MVWHGILIWLESSSLVASICNIPLRCKAKVNELYYFFFHPRGLLSIKNACKIARNERTKDKLTVRDFTYLFFDKLQWKNKVWRIIWKSKLKIPPEVQVFFWWVCCDILLARIRLDQIGVNIRNWCYFSDTYGEIVLLLFLECTTTRLDLGSLMDHILDGLPRSSSFLSQMEELV